MLYLDQRPRITRELHELNQRPAAVTTSSRETRESQHAPANDEIALPGGASLGVSAECPCCGARLNSRRAKVDLDTNTLLIRGLGARLQPTEAELLSVLLRRAPGLVSHDGIITSVWGAAETRNASNMVKTYVCSLNKKLRPLGARIENIFDRGYRFVEAA